jgi:hypothetical protein
MLASIDKQRENFTSACSKMKLHDGTGGERKRKGEEHEKREL